MQTQSPIPREFVHRFAAEHLHRLRQRVFWYCVAVLGLLALAFTRIALDMGLPPEQRGPTGFIALRFASATTLIVCYIGVALYILPAERGRSQIIKAYSLIIIATTLVVTLSMPRIDNGRFISGALPGEYGAAAVIQQGLTLFFVLLLHLIASLLVELSPRDGLRIYVPMLAIYTAGLAIDGYLSMDAKITFALIAPVLGLPGLLWSLWRHRAFADHFVTRAMADRYGQVSTQLAEARRVHEALFPPAQSHGPVRVRYRYEPMLDIGGDFLFIHPLQRTTSPATGPTSVVLIDVTGHGFPAALAVNRLYVELTRAFVSSDDPTPAHVVSELNRSMCSGLMPEAIFATAIVIRTRVENGTRWLEWCGAGHPAAMLCRADGSLVRLESSTPMLGVVEPDHFVAEVQKLEFGRGDRVIAFTDGVLEAKDAAGEQFGRERIERAVILARATGTPPPALQTDPAEIDVSGAAPPRPGSDEGAGPVDTLFTAVESFRDGPTLDDVLIVELLAAE